MNEADQLGSEYNSYSDQIKGFSKSRDKVAAKIKALAKKKGKIEGKQTIVTGEEFIVGFITTDPGEVIDPAKLRKKIGKDIWMQVTTRSIDEKKIVAAVKNGVISHDTLRKCMVPSDSEPQERLYVSTIKAKNEAPKTFKKKR